jgi:hypothetical protein
VGGFLASTAILVTDQGILLGSLHGLRGTKLADARSIDLATVRGARATGKVFGTVRIEHRGGVENPEELTLNKARSLADSIVAATSRPSQGPPFLSHSVGRLSRSRFLSAWRRG